MHVKHTKYKLIFSILVFILADLLIAYVLNEGVSFSSLVVNRTVLISSIVAAFLFYTIWSFFEERKY